MDSKAINFPCPKSSSSQILTDAEVLVMAEIPAFHVDGVRRAPQQGYSLDEEG